jgi:threonine dehydrogenase-like Zn-dependent dehydrogenase
MKAIAIVPGTAGARIVDRPEPVVAAADEIKLRVVSVGICGTDREEVAGGRAMAPDGQTDLVIGHEMIGQVVAIGAHVTHVAVGDYAVFTVRRGCGACASCNMGRSDMCETGNYRERGIHRLDGYQAEFVVDVEANVVRIPPRLAAIGVLSEPSSIVEKAIEETLRLQHTRRPDAAVTPDWVVGRRCLVAGLGPVGLLAAMILQLRGAKVYGMDVVDADNQRAQWLQAIGGEYLDGRQVAAGQVDHDVGPMDMIVEATGVPALEFSLFDALAINGAYVLTGIPGGNRPLQVPAAELVRRLVLANQLMLGSVNAARGHFAMAVADLERAEQRWPGHLATLITHYPVAQFGALAQHPGEHTIKEVIDWT